MSIISKVLWSITIPLMIYVGIYYTVKLKGIQFKFLSIFKSLKKEDKSNITPFQTLSMTLAGRIGVGSLSGIALSIYIGGEGTIFWMWIISILVCPLSYLESYLSHKYHVKKDDEYIGGPSHYISYGLNKKVLAKIYALVLVIAYTFAFSSIQSNTISKSIVNFFDIDAIIIGIIIASISILVIFKGLMNMLKFLEGLVPIMSLIFIISSCFIIFSNLDEIPNLFLRIFNSAFNFKAFGSGVFQTFIIGIQRGIFSNEAGIGTGGIASASSEESSSDKQGKIQMLGIYFTTLIICTLTAFVIILSDFNMELGNINGIELTNYAFTLFLGDIGKYVVLISIILFAFSTIIAAYYYSEVNIKYLTNNSIWITILKVITIIILVISSVMSSGILWNLVDILVAILALINIYALYKFKNKL